MNRSLLVAAWVLWLAATPFLARYLGYLMDWLVPPKIIWPNDPEGDPTDNMPRQTHLRAVMTVVVTATLLLGIPVGATYALSHYRPVGAGGALGSDAGV
ncbi:MAG: hypothetical protein ACLPJH_06530 [Myxococcaceae bacterium]